MPLPKILAVLTVLGLLAPWRAMADTTLLDPLQLLMQGSNSHDIFSAAIEAQIGMPPDYADVVFWHNETGEAIPYSDIRNLIGPSRQDAMLELLILAEAMTGVQGLPIESGRLARLIDAAYLASMRRPPEHVAVEFFDTRVGPTGDLTGGVSGHSPLNQRPPESAEERLAQLRERQQGQTAVTRTPRNELDPADWPTVDLDSVPRADNEKDAQLAGDRLAHKMNQAGLALNVNGINWSRMSMVVQREAELDSALELEFMALEERLTELSERPLAILDPLAYQHNGQLYLTLVVFHAALDRGDAALAFRNQTESLGLLEFNLEVYRQFESQR